MDYQRPRFFLFIILTVVDSVKATDLCPFDGDWTYHNSTGTCMILQRPPTYIFKAYQHCKEFSGGGRKNIPGHLVYIFDKDTDDFVKDLVAKRTVECAFIGLNKRISITPYTWGNRPSSEELGKDDYRGWATGQPSGRDISSVVITETGWKERALYEKNLFVCQVDAATDLCPFDGDWTYHNSTGTCMSLQRPAKDHFQANQHCKQFSGGGRKNFPGHLVYIFDKDTDDFVKDLVTKGTVECALIGLNNSISITPYTWGNRPSSEELGKDDYRGWATGQPSGRDISSVVITETGWKERALDEKTFFVCQVDAVVPIPKINCPPSEVGQHSSQFTCWIQFPDSLAPSSLRFQRAGRGVNSCTNLRCQNDDGYESFFQASSTMMLSVLQIKTVQRNHEDNWTCLVVFTNGQNSTSEPCGLRVYTPPRVLTFTIDHKENVAEVKKYVDVFLRCTATGYPQYQLSLLHDQGGEQILKTVSSFEVSHSLKATCHSMGRYTCLAERIEQDVQHVNLRVRCGPVHCLSTQKVPEFGIAVGPNKTVKICVVAYPAPTSFILFNGNSDEVMKTKYEVSFNYTNETTGRGEIRLTLVSVGQQDFHDYNLLSIELKQTSGGSRGVSSYLQFRLIKQGYTLPPSCPENLTVSRTFSDSITLSWKPGFDGGLQQSFTILRYGSGSTTEPQTVSVIPQPAGSLEDEMRYNVTGLSGSTTYTFGLRAENEEGVTECGLRVQGSTLASPLSSRDQSPNILTLIVVLAVLVLVLVNTVVVLVFVLVGRRRSKGVALYTDTVLTPTRLVRSSSRDDERVAYETIDDTALTEGVLNTDMVQTATSNGRPSCRNEEQNAYETANGEWLSEEVPHTDAAQTPASNGRPSNRRDEQNAYETSNGGWLPEEEKQEHDTQEENNEEAVYLNTQSPEGSNIVEGAGQGVVYANAAASDNIGEGTSIAREGGGASNYDCLTLTEDAFDDDGTYTNIKVDKGPAGHPQSEGVNVTEKSLYIDVI